MRNAVDIRQTATLIEFFATSGPTCIDSGRQSGQEEEALKSVTRQGSATVDMSSGEGKKESAFGRFCFIMTNPRQN